jgi:transcriptional regulator with XRE-family HTH domain
MMDFGKRLKEERERLGLSQAKFADGCGVGKTAQYTYEKGEREPSWSYMDAASKLGVDALYVFTGTRVGKDWAYARAYSKLLYTLEMLLGLEGGHLEDLCKEAVSLDEKMYRSEDTSEGQMVDFADWQGGVLKWLGTCSKPERCIDAKLLASLLESVKETAARLSVSLSTEKALRAALMAYRDAKPGNAIDHATLEDAVKLAAA